jgi:hypothetical protein
VFDSFDYLMSWGVYMGSVFLLLSFWWYWTRIIRWGVVRDLLRVLVFAVLLVPVPESPGSTYMAPAFMVSAFDGLSLGMDAAERGAVPIFWSAAIAALLVIVYHGARLAAEKKHK